MTSPNTTTAEEPTFAEERRDNRIVALIMSATVLGYLTLLYAHNL